MSKLNLFDMEDSNNNSFGDVNLEVENSSNSIDLSVYTMKRSDGNKFGSLNVKAGSSAEKIRELGIAVSNVRVATPSGKMCQDNIINELDTILNVDRDDVVVSKKDWGNILSVLGTWITIKGEATHQLQTIYDAFSKYQLGG